MFVRQGMPVNYEPRGTHYRRVVHDSALLSLTTEAYLLNTDNCGVLVVSFDANVCVFANIFGAMESYPLPSGAPIGTVTPVREPLIARCDVVISRAVVVTANPSNSGKAMTSAIRTSAQTVSVHGCTRLADLRRQHALKATAPT